MTNDPVPGPQSAENAPAGWKSMDDFAAGIDGNRLPSTGTLAGRRLRFDDEVTTVLEFVTGSTARWHEVPGDDGVECWYEAVPMREQLYLLTVRRAGEPLRVDVFAVDLARSRYLRVVSRIAEQRIPGEPRVGQQFCPGVVDGGPASGEPPAQSRDLIGLRALYRYSPDHLYEHVYLSSERYAWQCLVGEQRGHGDVDLATTWKLADDLYVFTFREFIIPVAATWLYDFAAKRTVGVFVGLSDEGQVRVVPGGAEITLLGRVAYPDEQPV